MIVLIAALFVLLRSSLSGHAESVTPNGLADAGDLDPAVFPLLDALLHLREMPDPGPLRSATTDGHGIMLHFAGLAVLLPDGQPDTASVPSLIATLLDRQVAVPLLTGSTITYGTLATAAPRTIAASAIPAFLDADGTLLSLPLGALPPALAAPETRITGGFHVPLPFNTMVATDAPPRPTSHTPDAIGRQASDLARAGMPLRDPVWIRTANGYRLVQPFTRRVLVWDPLSDAVSATDAADAAQRARLIPDGGAGGTFFANLLLRLMSVEETVGVAVAYRTPGGTLTVSLRGTVPYPAASVMKLAILAACEDGIARGELQRDADVDAQEEAMIVYSDNDAANALIDFAGRARINDLMRRIGMAQSYFGSHFDTAYGDDDADNFLVPRESLLLMDALLRGDVGDAAWIRDLLGRSEAPGSVRDAFATAGVNVPVYEKRGWYDGLENDVVHLDLGNGTALTIAVFAPDVAESETAWALFTDLAQLGVASSVR
ncbi:MAG: serine hydrolase [Thermomicrobiales bacterium]